LATLTHAFEVMPSLKEIYNEQTGRVMGLCYLENLDVELAGMDGTFEKL